MNCYWLFHLHSKHLAVVYWTNLAINLKYFVLKPVFVAGLMGIGVNFAHKKFISLSFAQNQATVLAITLGAIIYTIVLLYIGGFRKNDLELLPGGYKIVMFLDKFGVFRR